MGYIERKRYIIVNDDDIKEELLTELYSSDKVKPTKARQLIYYSKPLTLCRWGKYLTIAQIKKYLVPVDDIENIDNIGI